MLLPPLLATAEAAASGSSSPTPPIESAPPQACNAKTARSISPEQVKQLGYSWGKALAHEKVKFHGEFAKILI